MPQLTAPQRMGEMTFAKVAGITSYLTSFWLCSLIRFSEIVQMKVFAQKMIAERGVLDQQR
ncbi:hypothetical protein KSX_53110 [Ktedonospora formicarum]|uniref:Uncharacterized protein n=1 Tax=Ktedonospora formicarum TaxID=2778364 RepID=A0A8J3I7C5_9CHLR|nr:hypothetical protein KSX_53110 [Ktedonospora formicarum]